MFINEHMTLSNVTYIITKTLLLMSMLNVKVHELNVISDF